MRAKNTLSAYAGTKETAAIGVKDLLALEFTVS